MKFIDKLERKFGRFGIPNLTIYIIGCYVLGYILTAAAPGVLSMLSLDMSMVMKGQIWRLVTWVIYPPSSVGGMSKISHAINSPYTNAIHFILMGITNISSS